jgi:outer membrane immunogenic protein
MRWATVGLIAVGFVQPALAADYDGPVLRGSNVWTDVPPPGSVSDWSGFYIGGHVGYSSARGDLGTTGSSIIADILRLTLLEEEFNVSQWVSPEGHGNASPVGGFVGYNWQFDDTVFGIDATYSRLSAMIGGTDSLARNVTTSDSSNYDVFVSSTMGAKLTDILSIRGRGGAMFGSFMPYGTLGIAVGRAQVIRQASVTTIEYVGGVPQAPISETRDESKKGAWAYGLSAGLGFDWEIVPRMFLRGEYEYVGFAAIEDIKVSVHTARGGLGVRF